MHSQESQSMNELKNNLEQLHGKPYGSYRQLQGKSFAGIGCLLCFEHIQGSPGAYPASVCSIRLQKKDLNLDDQLLSNGKRVFAAKDYLLRSFNDAAKKNAKQNRGSQGSGSFQPPDFPPQILERNCVRFDKGDVILYFRISLPGTSGNSALGKQASEMFMIELPRIIKVLEKNLKSCDENLKKQCDSVEDHQTLQASLKEHNLVAFIADESVLPRESGISEIPLKKDAVPFYSPKEESVLLNFPNAGKIRGLGIRSGVTVFIGGGFHGKSTLLDALVRSVYPHIPGDGRECVITDSSAVFICSEDGRSVNGVDISGFISGLPGGSDTRRFVTGNASGSTSEAAAIVEAVLSGARLLLIDEDSSATNFLVRDSNMRRLIPEDPIIPLFDRVRELYDDFGVSTLIVTGGSSDYIGVADHVIAMRDYLPVSMTEQAKSMVFQAPSRPSGPMNIQDLRRLLPNQFNPSYRAERIGKTIPIRIKPLRLYDKILEYGDFKLDLTSLKGLVDSDQVLALGFALLFARNRFGGEPVSPTELANMIDCLIEKEGIDALGETSKQKLFLARPRLQDLAGAINRMRNLCVRF